MSTFTPSAVEMQTCSQEVPSVPVWFPAVVILARQFAQRSLLETISTPGSTGRKRGELVRVRTTILQAQQWLGTVSGAGTGAYGAELEATCQRIAAYLRARGLSVSHGLLRLAGVYGTAAI